MIDQELEVTLHTAFVEARQKRHTWITVEHLLLALLDNSSAAKLLGASTEVLNHLRDVLTLHIDENTPRSKHVEADTQPTLGFQRAIQRAILSVQSSDRSSVTGADVLLAIFADTNSSAVQFLNALGISRPQDASHPRTTAREEQFARQLMPSEERQALPDAVIAQDLETSLHMAFVDARKKRHEFMTVEHMLLALIDNSTASTVLQGCGANLSDLRWKLTQHVDEQTPQFPVGQDIDPQPTLGFQRARQTAILKVQATGRSAVTGADALVAIYQEKDSHAVHFLEEQGVTRYEVVCFLSHGGRKGPEVLPESIVDLQVVLFNDDYTPMEFVVAVLQDYFSMTREDATETMLEVHRQGKVVTGLYAREIALDLVKQVHERARMHGHPLRCEVAIPSDLIDPPPGST